MRDAIISILGIAEASDRAAFADSEMLDWRDGMKDALLSEGILKELDHTRAIECDGCDNRCIEKVRIRKRAGGSVIATVYCGARDDIGSVNVPLDRLRRWGIDWDRLAQLVGESLGASGPSENIVPRRLWRLGGNNIYGMKAELFLAVGLERAGGNDLRKEIRSHASLPSPVVIIPSKKPPGRFGDFRFVCIRSIMNVSNGRSLFSLDELAIILGAKKKSKNAPVVVKTFPLSAGKDFTAVAMTLYDGGKMDVNISGAGSEVYSYEDMGFADGRRTPTTPNDLWGVLNAFAQFHGQITWKDNIGSQKERANLKKQVSLVSSVLQTFFQTNESPFHPYSKEDGYRTRFVITDSRTNK